MAAKIEVEGLRDFQRQLKQMDTNLPKQLRVALNEASGIVVDYAQAHIPVKTGRAKASLKARSTQKEARVALGSTRARYAPWLDFGGEGKRRGRPSYRVFKKDGRYVYKGLEVKRDKVIEVLNTAIVDLAKSAGFEVT